MANRQRGVYDINISYMGMVEQYLSSHSFQALHLGSSATGAISKPPPPPFLSLRTSSSLQTPNIPPGISGQRYRVTYQSESSTFARSRYLYPSRAQSRASKLNVTITRLQRDTEYRIQVRVDVRYRFCFSYLFGNFSEAIHASTNATSEHLCHYVSNLTHTYIPGTQNKLHRYMCII